MMKPVSFVQDMKSLWSATKQSYLSSNEPINALRNGIDSRLGGFRNGMPVNSKLYEAVGGTYKEGVRKTDGGRKAGDTYKESADGWTDSQRLQSLFYDRDGEISLSRIGGAAGVGIAGSYLALR